MKNTPIISLAMPCYQQVAFLEEAVRSVLDRQDAEAEVLVMDPGSTDGSRELLVALQKEYGGRLILNFEPDKGQSDAVNKAIERSRGRILGWLNSDDRLRPGVLSKVVDLLDSSQPGWLYGRAGMIDESGASLNGFIVQYKNWRSRKFSRLKLLTENFIPQMTVFWNRAMWDRAGKLDLDRHLDMDYDLWLRFAEVSQPLVLTDILADFRVHREAKGSRQYVNQLEAAFMTSRKHAIGMGWRGRVALLIHRLLAWRTRLLYHWLKPGEKI